MIRFYLGTDERQRIWDIRKLRVLAGESLDATLSTSATSSPLRKRKADSAKRSIVEYSHDVVTKFDDSEEGVGLLRGDYAHDKSCSSAYWDPRGRQVVSTSYDNNIRCMWHSFWKPLPAADLFHSIVWNLDGPTLDSSDPFESFRPFSRLRHDCQTVSRLH